MSCREVTCFWKREPPPPPKPACVYLGLLWLSQVNGVDFSRMTREEAAMFLLNLRKGDPVEIFSQNKMDSEYMWPEVGG